MQSNISYRINGGLPISGQITCMGAKNFATKAMVAALLCDDIVTLNNIPRIGDVEITELLIKSIGAEVTWKDSSTIQIDSRNLDSHIVTLPDSKSNRIPILLLGILLHRFGKADVPTVRGDEIGKRNVDFHIDAIIKFGATIESTGSKYSAYAPNGLSSTHITLPYPSVGATETCLFLGVLAKGTSVIRNIAIEPEIIQLITMLRSMGAEIFLDSGRNLTIYGVKKLRKTNIHAIGDRIEAASWASLACASGGKIEVSGIRPELLGNFLSYYNQIGGSYQLVDAETILFYSKGALSPVTIETDVYPGFSTDWQQPFATLLTQANGMSVIHETVYEQRFGYLEVLNKLGAKTQTTKMCLGSLDCRYKGCDYAHSALIHGPTALTAIDEPIDVPDIRAGLAYLIAAALAEGTTILTAATHIERGYGNLIDKLSKTNLEIERIPT